LWMRYPIGGSTRAYTNKSQGLDAGRTKRKGATHKKNSVTGKNKPPPGRIPDVTPCDRRKSDHCQRKKVFKKCVRQWGQRSHKWGRGTSATARSGEGGSGRITKQVAREALTTVWSKVGGKVRVGVKGKTPQGRMKMGRGERNETGVQK